MLLNMFLDSINKRIDFREVFLLFVFCLFIPQMLTPASYSQFSNLPKTALFRFGISLVQLCRNASNQTDYGPAATRLRFPVPLKARRMRRAEGVGSDVTGRMMLLRRYVSKLLDDERIELPWPHAVETRLYAERLIQEGVLASTQQNLVSLFELWKNSNEPKIDGKLNVGILELSVFWLTEERLVEKLFKVFVPRYRLYQRAYTTAVKKNSNLSTSSHTVIDYELHPIN
ncbi:mitochondrial ribosomal protein L17 [Schistosoma japonicum]|nr:mitochondrial ribosomal protein L17 [Schistosoma japonicum]